MKRRVQWGLGLAFLVAAGLGCGRQDPQRSIEISVPPPATPEEPTLPSSTSPPVAELPPSTAQTPAPSPTPAPAPGPTPTPPSAPVPTAQWWQVYPEPSPMPSEVPACVPRGAPTGTRFAHPCTVKKFSLPWATTAEALQRWDAAGHLLEDSEGHFSDGSWSSQTLCTYTPRTESCETNNRAIGRHSSSLTTYDDQGHKVRQERHEDGLIKIDEWSYDAWGRVVSHTLGIPDLASNTRDTSTYDDQGRLSSTVTSTARSDGSWWVDLRLRYRYGQEGLLLGIDQSDDPDGYTPRWSPSRTFTYYPNGQLKSKREDPGLSPNCSCYSTQEFDEQGRQISDYRVGDEFESHSTWTYANQVRSEEMYLDSESSRGVGHAWYSQRHDDAGRLVLERMISDFQDWDAASPRRVLSFTRSTYACETGDLLQEESLDGEGVRAGLHELQRDAAGNLQVERFSGSSSPGGLYPRIEYDYSCLQ